MEELQAELKSLRGRLEEKGEEKEKEQETLLVFQLRYELDSAISR